MAKTRLRSTVPTLEELLERARHLHESIHHVDSADALHRAFEAGDLLLAIKARLKHGAWSAALASTGIPSSTARLYMQLARERERILAAGCTSIREARRLLAGTKPRQASTTTGRRRRPVADRYQEGYDDGYRRGRADGYSAGQAAGQTSPRAGRSGVGPGSLDPKDLRWLIKHAHPDKHPDDLHATRVTQWLNAHLEHARKQASSSARR